ncbi:MAG: hypothetical protein M4579_002367 [Chaenotheca gracillima]|nr:MAG: hypothetical protein M4579_002367 [Chaenotheca gracillima]
MPDLELAVLRLPQPAHSISESLRTSLRDAKDAVESLPTISPRVKMWYYTQIDDPCLLYIMAGWPSARSHYEDWIQTPQNQAGMQVITEAGVKLVELVHIGGVTMEDFPCDAPVISVASYFVKEDRRGEFERTLRVIKNGVDKGSWREGAACGGWTVEEKEGEDPCWVAFSDWESKEEHDNSAETDESKRSEGTREWISPSNVAHIQGIVF